jgi:hypothetical protein
LRSPRGVGLRFLLCGTALRSPDDHRGGINKRMRSQ